uniref:Uncharacterized protein n=1 Tax=Rhizobium rhizogenes TaxID=359 RepID=A0A7S4ZUZ7_RHIRH|nr:hypothetical protein pC5.8d_748 [Rhizobium rhizogenes]
MHQQAQATFGTAGLRQTAITKNQLLPTGQLLLLRRRILATLPVSEPGALSSANGNRPRWSGSRANLLKDLLEDAQACAASRDFVTLTLAGTEESVFRTKVLKGFEPTTRDPKILIDESIDILF